MRQLRYVVAATSVMWVWLLVTAAPAAAHAELRRSVPAAGERLDRAPAEFRLEFTEPVTLVEDGFRLLDENGVEKSVAAADATGATVIMPVASLPDGGYVLLWRVVSGDSHPVVGAIPFAVGDAVPPAADPAARGSDALVSFLMGLTRWAGYLGTALLVGSLAVVALCWPAGTRRDGVRRMLLLGAASAGGAAAVGLLTQGPYAAGRPLSGVIDPDLLQATLSTAYGRAGVARIAIVAALAAWALSRIYRSGRGSWPIGIALGLLLAATFSAQGHAWAAEQRLVAVVTDALHVLAMATWLGGLAVLVAVALRPGAVEQQPRDPLPHRPVPEAAGGGPAVVTRVPVEACVTHPPTPVAKLPDLRRWSRLAMSCVAVLVVTGTLASLREVGSWSALANTRYGALLLAKLALVALLLGIAARARAWVQRNASAEARHVDPPPVSALRRSVMIEAGMGALVLAVTAALVSTTPGAAAEAPSPRATGTLPDGTVATVTVDDRRLLEVRVETGDERPVAPVEVSARASLPARGVEDLPVDLHRSGDTWVAHDDALPFAGTWRVTVTVRTSEIDAGVTTVTLPVT